MITALVIGFVAAFLAYTGTYARYLRHRAYLENLLDRALDGVAVENRWDHRCEHCHHRLHGADHTAYPQSWVSPGGGTRHRTVVYHAGRPKCVAAAGQRPAAAGK